MKIKVTTVAFSKNKRLVNKAESIFTDVHFNKEGRRLTKTELVEFLKDADAAIIGLDKINEEALLQLPKLKYVSKFGVGLDNVDLEACKKHNVKVLWKAGVNKTSVAEITLGYMLDLSRNIYLTSNELKGGRWLKNGGSQLTGKTVGIIGLGFIGLEVVRLLKPFNCKILGNDIMDKTEIAKQNNIKLVEKEEIYQKSDIISIHTPLTYKTINLINRKILSIMKQSSILINTARGSIVNEEDLKEALIKGEISGAGLDVYESEPPDNKEFISLPNLICTPHIAGNSLEAVYQMGISAINNLTLIKSDNENI